MQIISIGCLREREPTLATACLDLLFEQVILQITDCLCILGRQLRIDLQLDVIDFQQRVDDLLSHLRELPTGACFACIHRAALPLDAKHPHWTFRPSRRILSRVTNTSWVSHIRVRR